jgi:hypothetical protein
MIGSPTVGNSLDAVNDQAVTLPLSFAGDVSYPTGGTLAISAFLQTTVLKGRDIVGIIPQDCGGYIVTYLPATDALKVYWCAGSGAVPVEVTAATNLSGVTFNILFLLR